MLLQSAVFCALAAGVWRNNPFCHARAVFTLLRMLLWGVFGDLAAVRETHVSLLCVGQDVLLHPHCTRRFVGVVGGLQSALTYCDRYAVCRAGAFRAPRSLCGLYVVSHFLLWVASKGRECAGS